MRKRPVLFATAAVVILGTFGATSVFLVGSKQRRDDRKAYLAYERAVVVPIRETRRVAQEMRTQLAELRGTVRAPVVAPAILDGWRRALATARSEVLALEPPSFVRGVEAAWVSAIGWYAYVADRFAQGAVQRSEEALARADDLLNDAARLMQLHRRRLGLGATNELPDPTSTDEP